MHNWIAGDLSTVLLYPAPQEHGEEGLLVATIHTVARRVGLLVCSGSFRDGHLSDFARQFTPLQADRLFTLRSHYLAADCRWTGSWP